MNWLKVKVCFFLVAATAAVGRAQCPVAPGSPCTTSTSTSAADSTNQANTLAFGLLSFAGNASSSRVQLYWQVNTSLSFSSFEIQRAEEGSANYLTIGKVVYEPNNAYYSFYDNAASGKYWYRLKMTSTGGKFIYSFILPLTVINQSLSLSIAPNPATSQINVSGLSGSGYLCILSLSGNEIFKKAFNSYSAYIDISRLQAGIYLLRVVNQNTPEQVLKIVKRYS